MLYKNLVYKGDGVKEFPAPIKYDSIHLFSHEQQLDMEDAFNAWEEAHANRRPSARAKSPAGGSSSSQVAMYVPTASTTKDEFVLETLCRNYKRYVAFCGSSDMAYVCPIEDYFSALCNPK